MLCMLLFSVKIHPNNIASFQKEKRHWIDLFIYAWGFEKWHVVNKMSCKNIATIITLQLAMYQKQAM